MKNSLSLLSAVVALLASDVALAHQPFCECKSLDAQTILCRGGFSDGGSAAGIVLDVIAADETPLGSYRLDERSEQRFTRPTQPFYVLLDAGAGHVVEIEERDIR